MANYSWLPPSGSLEVNVCELFGQLVIGSSGAVTSNSGKGIGTIVKESAAGQYTIPLSQGYNSLLFASFTLLSTTDGAQTIGTAFRLNSEDVDHLTAPKIVLQCSDTATGADANLTSGDIVYFRITLKNSSVA